MAHIEGLEFRGTAHVDLSPSFVKVVAKSICYVNKERHLGFDTRNVGYYITIEDYDAAWGELFPIMMKFFALKSVGPVLRQKTFAWDSFMSPMRECANHLPNWREGEKEELFSMINKLIDGDFKHFNFPYDSSAVAPKEMLFPSAYGYYKTDTNVVAIVG